MYISFSFSERTINPSLIRKKSSIRGSSFSTLVSQPQKYVYYILSKKIDGTYTCTRPERKIRISRNVNKHYCGPRSASFASRVQKTHRR